MSDVRAWVPPFWMSLGLDVSGNTVFVLGLSGGSEAEALDIAVSRAPKGAAVAAFEMTSPAEQLGSSIAGWLTANGVPGDEADGLVREIARKLARTLPRRTPTGPSSLDTHEEAPGE